MEDHPLVCYGDRQVSHLFVNIINPFIDNFDEKIMVLIKHSNVFVWFKQSLANSLSNRDIESFRRALHSPTEVEKYDVTTSLTIFEKACQTADSAQFIEECILAGCDVNKVEKKYFIRISIFCTQCVQQFQNIKSF